MRLLCVVGAEMGVVGVICWVAGQTLRVLTNGANYAALSTMNCICLAFGCSELSANRLDYLT